jgi:thioredoxin reductase
MNHQTQPSTMRVAVVGAGAAGLVAARECIRQGFEVRVFEKSDKLGGVWQYSDRVEDDLLGQNPKEQLHGSLYKSLRTNLPRMLMAYRDFPFEADEGVSQFVSHERVCKYLEDFADHFGLRPVIDFGNGVTSVQSAAEGKWLVAAENGGEEMFDAVIVCNGHYARPRVPMIPGMDGFEGILMHSHNYRVPDPFKGKRVALFGAAASALDLSLEINPLAEQVYWCAEQHSDIDVGDEIMRCGSPKSFGGKNLILKNGEVIEELDTFIFATGYHYQFPFLEEGIINVVDNWVHPLYKELVPPAYPTISFIGLPYAVIPFPLFEIQVKWVTRMLAGQFELPAEAEMNSWCTEKAAWLKGNKPKQRNFHKKGLELYVEMDQLAADCSADSLPDWFVPLAETVRLKRLEDPASYRDCFVSNL